MESRGPEDSKNVKTSQAYFFEGFISFFEDFSLTNTYIYTYIHNVKMDVISGTYILPIVKMDIH